MFKSLLKGYKEEINFCKKSDEMDERQKWVNLA